MDCKIPGRALHIAVTGVTHKAEKCARRYCFTDLKVFCILRQMGIIKICTGRTPDSDPVAAKTEPAYIFHNAVGHTVDRIYAPHIFRCHDIGSLMSAVAAKSPALHPAIFKYNVIFRFSCDLSHRKTQKVTPDAFDISVYLCKFIATIFFCICDLFLQQLRICHLAVRCKIHRQKLTKPFHIGSGIVKKGIDLIFCQIMVPQIAKCRFIRKTVSPVCTL